MYKSCFYILFFGFSISLFAQNKSLKDYEKELNELSLEIVNNDSDKSKYKANDEFKSLLLEVLNTKGSFDYDFKKIQAISILKSNETIKLYNWAIPKKDETFEYCAFLQIKTDKDTYKIVEFTDKSDEISKPETKTLSNKNWYGALYYNIIYDKKLGKDTYTLLGWDGHYNLANRKIIDVMTVSSNGSVRFGSPILKLGKKAQRRVIFTYSETAVMSLKYHEKDKRIVFDYLVPTASNLAGVFEYYGPSLNRFDAFVIDKGKWVYQQDVDIQMNRNLKDNFWKDPKGDN
ncbi:MAG: hypothetical protein KDD29_02525 [Flavobacteriales bacterium]|nr:hypothetical protein [Flavobacteriales bacterium]